jgi:DNA-binding transcriptional MerR regulator
VSGQSLKIREVSRTCGITLRALRFYEQKGLMSPRRVSRVHRLYSDNDLERLRSILKLKALGLSLAEVRKVLASPAEGPYGLSAKLCAELIERLSAQRERVNEALAILREISQQFTPEATRPLLGEDE